MKTKKRSIQSIVAEIEDMYGSWFFETYYIDPQSLAEYKTTESYLTFVHKKSETKWRVEPRHFLSDQTKDPKHIKEWPHHFYIAEFFHKPTRQVFYKVGMTSKLSVLKRIYNRLNPDFKYKETLIFQKCTYLEAAEKEKTILKYVKRHGKNVTYDLGFGGHDECFIGEIDTTFLSHVLGFKESDICVVFHD